jgi:hypothetical protein
VAQGMKITLGFCLNALLTNITMKYPKLLADKGEALEIPFTMTSFDVPLGSSRAGVEKFKHFKNAMHSYTLFITGLSFNVPLGSSRAGV